MTDHYKKNHRFTLREIFHELSKPPGKISPGALSELAIFHMYLSLDDETKESIKSLITLTSYKQTAYKQKEKLNDYGSYPSKMRYRFIRQALLRWKDYRR